MSDTGSTGRGPDDQDPGTPPPPPPPPSGGGTPPPPPPPPAETGNRTGQAADIGIRLGARLIDFIILAIVGAIISAFLVDVDSANPFAATMSMTTWVATLITTAINVGYFAYLESSRGQTLGKQLLNLRVIGPDGGHPTLEQGIKRNLWMAAAIIPAIGGLIELGLVIWIIISVSQSVDKRGVHDNFADGTQVVRT